MRFQSGDNIHIIRILMLIESSSFDIESTYSLGSTTSTMHYVYIVLVL